MASTSSPSVAEDAVATPAQLPSTHSTTSTASTASASAPSPPKHRLSRKATPFVVAQPTSGNDGDATASQRPRRLAPRRSSSASASGGAKTTARAVGVSPAERRRLDELAKASASASAPATVQAPVHTRPPPPKLEFRTTAMIGDGFYNRNCTPQREAVRAGLAAFARACEALPSHLVDGCAVRIADFGSSQGLNSVLPMRVAVGALADRAETVDVVHQDLPTNDFNSLFDVTLDKATGYVGSRTNVFVGARGGDHHTRQFAAGSLTLAWSSITNHWLSAPNPVRGQLALSASGAASAGKAGDELRALARRDWADYVRAREAELAPGAQLVAVELCANAAVSESAIPQPATRLHLIETAFDAVAAEIGKDAAVELSVPVYYRTKEEFLEPFAEFGGFSRLRVVEATETRSYDPITAEFERTHDVAAFVDSALGFFHAACAGALCLDKQPAEVVDRVNARVRAAIEADPTAFTFGFTVLVLRVEKVVGE